MSHQTIRPWTTSYAPGVTSDIPEHYDTLSHAFARSVHDYGSRVATDFLGATLTYRQLGEQVDAVAEGLRGLGVTRGDRVALVMPNCPQHVAAFYAVLRLGAIVVEHNPQYTRDELQHQFADHGARVAIVWDAVADTIASFDTSYRPEHLITVSLISALPLSRRLALSLPVAKARAARATLGANVEAPHLRFERMAATTPPIADTISLPDLDDVAVLQYTSGTTGAPKAAMLTHRSLRANQLMGEAWVPGLRPGAETFACVLPFFHAYGLTLCLSYGVAMGASLLLMPKFDLDLFVAGQRRRPVTFLAAVPPIYDHLSAAAEAGRIDLHSIRFSISGAMALSAESAQRWEQITGGLLVEGYGMTEASPIIAGNPMGPSRRSGTVGVPFPGTDVRVVDPENPTHEVAPGEPGELIVDGPQLFVGYWNRPAETAQMLIDGRWLRTGDIVTMSDDGFITVVDRIKELIVTGGFNVSPSEVEAVLCSHPDVRQAAVVGAPQPSGNEEVSAALVLREGSTLDVAALRAFCQQTLARYKVPRNFISVESLPTSMVGKVLRRKVRDLLFGRTQPAA